MTSNTLISIVPLLLALLSFCHGTFVSVHHINKNTALFMGKGFNKGNKQAELQKKMQLAKQKREEPTTKQQEKEAPLSQEEIKKRNDRLRFEELLQRESSSVLNNYAKDGYLSQDQEEEEITAARLGIDRLFEGDEAPLDPFEDLVLIQSGNALGKAGATRLLGNDYVILLTDPRPKSSELRLTMQNLSSLPKDLLARLAVINADTPAENKRWIKKSGVNSVNIYSDEKMDFMRAYTALGEKRWAMCMFIVAQGRIQKLAREVNPIVASRVIQNAVKSLDI